MSRKLVKTVKLEVPVKWGEGDDSEMIGELDFHEITAADMQLMPVGVQPTVGDFLKMAAASTGQPFAVLLKMCPRDAVTVANEAADFFAPGQETGST